ncbi:MAG: AAA family ATPase [Inquilinaceae bacterium]
MRDCANTLFVITGGPGSGKTTLINALAGAGLATREEVGRRIIKDQVAVSGPAVPWRDPMLYADLMLSWEMRSWREAAERDGPIYFDRGIPDILGYLRLLDRPIPDHMRRAAALFRYGDPVFVCLPWRRIYTQDDERKQNFETAQRTHAAMVDIYTTLGYSLVTIPPGPVGDRLMFVRERAG